MIKKGVRHKLANYLFYKEVMEYARNGEVIPFNKASEIGIIYDATQEDDYQIVKELVKEIRGQHKDVLALGYIGENTIPPNRFIKLGLDFFTKKSLNWKLRPNCNEVSSFIERRFDILICLNIDKNIPLKYVASMSNAKFKIGRYDETNTHIYDFMISVNDQTNLKQFITQVKHYINQVQHDNQ